MNKILKYSQLFLPLFNALKGLGGSGNNDEILKRVITDLQIPDEITDILHGNSQSMTELYYQLCWARTYLKSYGIITNSERGVWTIKPEYINLGVLDEKDIITEYRRKSKIKKDTLQSESDADNNDANSPDEIKSWREQLAYILQNMDPYGRYLGTKLQGTFGRTNNCANC